MTHLLAMSEDSLGRLQDQLVYAGMPPENKSSTPSQNFHVKCLWTLPLLAVWSYFVM